MKNIQRGDIFYIKKGLVSGSEQMAGRPGIVVSNDSCNKYSPVIEIVYLTGMARRELPTHVKIHSSEIPSIALCEQIHSVSKNRFSTYIGRITRSEQAEINKALSISLELVGGLNDALENCIK